MPTPAFSKNITAIFNSNGLREDLKYDITCRLVGEALQVTTVSLLLYDVEDDQLKCKGSYLAPPRKTHNNVTTALVLERIVTYIGVFEYFDAQLAENNENSWADFDRSIICGEMEGKRQMPPELFELLKKDWQNPYFRKAYHNYKDHLHFEGYQINADVLSSQYFSSLLALGREFTYRIEKRLVAQGPRLGTTFTNIWAKAGVTINLDGLYYIGLPLFTSGRYVGILRITTYRPSSSIDSLFDKHTQEEGVKQEERLINFAQLVSLHLMTNFYLDGYRMLSNLKIGKAPNLKTRDIELNEVCNAIRSIINCYGCMIRLALDASPSKSPPIKGHSDSLKDFCDYIATLPSPIDEFSEDIGNILRPGQGDHSIRAINFSMSDDIYTDVFPTLEYYYDKENRLRYNTHPGRKFRDFVPEYVDNLQRLNLWELVVIRLEYNKSGFLILTNSKNRKFTPSDIEMVLLASKKIDLEIKHLQDQERNAELNRIITQQEHAKVIVHQIGSPANAISRHIQNLHDGVYKEHELPLKIHQLNNMAFLLLRQINTLQKYLDWETKPIVPQKDGPYRLENYLRTKAIQFEGLTSGTRLKIWTLIDNKDNFYEECFLQRSLLDEILNCLLDNAVKYSFTPIDMIRRQVPIDFEDPSSEGHIHIRVNNTQEQLIFTVENYGSAIDPHDYYNIFERGFRGKQGKMRTPSGSGIGLFLAKKVVQAFGGNIDVVHDKQTHKTSFKVTLAHKVIFAHEFKENISHR